MNNVNQRPVTVPTEQEAAYEAVENGSSGFEPQSDDTKDVAYSGGDEPQVSNSASNAEQLNSEMKEEEMKQVSGNGTASHTEENAKVDPPKADKEGEQIFNKDTTVMNKLGLEENVVYYMNKLGFNKVCPFAIHSNRKDQKQISDKLKSCEAVGVQTPVIITDASIVLKAGYKLDDYQTGKTITSLTEIMSGYATMEGHNRIRAFIRSLEKASKDPNYVPFDLPLLYRRYLDPESFRQAYHHMNLYNVPTKTSDFANDILATTQLPALIKYKEKIAAKLTPKAAGLATVGREIVKRDMKDIFNDKIPSDLQGEEMLVITEPIYNAVMQAFCSEKKAKPIVKGTPIWTYNAKKLNASMDKKAESEKLVKLYSGLGSRECSELMDAKAEGGRTKEQIIHQILEKCYSAL